MLTIKKRQTYLKELGYYSGKVDGKEKKLTKQAYLRLQEDHFTRKKDIDGIYGKNTDILLQNAYNVHICCKNFKLKEFRCKCIDKKKNYCTGYPAVMNPDLLKYIQEERDLNGSIKITSGLRCEEYNDEQKGSSKTSAHMDGDAVDYFNIKACLTHARRKKTVDRMIKKPKIKYAYCDDYARTKTKTTYPNANNMGRSIHTNV
jgi:uncharacterized protein YcbK (DUF882 family)